MNEQKAPTDSTNSRLDAALRYTARGWSAIPVDAEKKALIVWKPYQTERATEQQIKDWWQQFPDANVAIVAGEVSGLVCLDVDIDKGANEADVAALNMPTTVRAKTPHGYHVYFKHPGGRVAPSTSKIASRVDVRADSSYVVAPPSVNAEGLPYAWELAPGECEIADIPPALLERLRQPSKNSDDAISAESSGAGEKVYEGGRNDAATRQAGKILGHLSPDLWDADGWARFRLWNIDTCVPPLEDTELRMVFDSIKATEARNNNAGPSASTWTPSITLAELCAKEMPDHDWLVDRIFAKGTVNMVSAAPNSYKTWLLLDLAFRVANGEPFLGQFKTAKSGVLIVNEDDTERMIRSRSISLLADSSANRPASFHVGKGFKLGKEIVGKLLDEMKCKDLSVIIFDTLSSVHTADENSAKEMTAVLDLLKMFTREGYSVILSHHHRKKAANGGKDDPQEQTRGSSVINAILGTQLAIKEHIKEGQKHILIEQAKLKDAEKLKPFLAKIESNDGSIVLTYAGEHDSAAGTLEKLREAILGLLKTHAWVTKKFLQERVRHGDKAVRDAIKGLVDDGVVRSETRNTLKTSGAEIPGVGQHNEKLYSLAAEDKSSGNGVV